ncbi:MAG: serine hydrolase [Phycicoccus sp.]
MNREVVDPADALLTVFRHAGCRGWVHARPVVGPRGDDEAAERDWTEEVALGADEPVPVASVYKLAVAATWADLADAGELDPLERMVLAPADRTPGPTGLSGLLDVVEMSARDVVRLMLTLSDNAAADHVLDLAGGARRVTATMHRWGLAQTVVRRGTRQVFDRIRDETGAGDIESLMAALADIHRDVRIREYDPALASTSTARELTALLALLWRRRIAPGPAGDHVRACLRGQVWPHRLRSGFPHDDVVVAGKTGTLGVFRHEVGVVEFPGEVPVAVAVLTRAARPEQHLPVVDAAIGRAAARAVRPLRRPHDGDARPARRTDR